MMMIHWWKRGKYKILINLIEDKFKTVILIGDI